MDPNINNNQNNFLIGQKDNYNNIDSNLNPNIKIINLKKKENDYDFSPAFKNSIHFMKKKREKQGKEKNVNIINKNKLPEIPSDGNIFLNDEFENKMNKNIKLEESIHEVQTELNNLNFGIKNYEKNRNFLENINADKEDIPEEKDKMENFMINDFDENNEKYINEDNNNSNKMDEEMDPYSFRFFTDDDNFHYRKLRGEKELSIEFIIENNGKLAWPENETFLLIDENRSAFKIKQLYLFPLQPQEKCFVYFKFKDLDKYKPGLYKNYLVFNVKGQKFGNDIIIDIEKY